MGLVILVAVVAILVGWHVSKVHGSHVMISPRRRQLREDRRGRLHYGVRLVAVAIVFALVIVIGWLALR